MARIKPLKLMVYSDIHYGYYQNGLTVEDVKAVDQEIFQIAMDQNVDAFLFGGDWFIDKNPPNELRAIRDSQLAEKSTYKPVIILPGNHDRETKSMHSVHNLEHVKIWNYDNMITIMDKADDYTFPDLDLVITAIPAGHKFAGIKETNMQFRICMFHDMILGSMQQNGHPAKHGESLNKLDHPEFDLLLGGDNHVHQKLGCVNTFGYYIGAPMQHNWGDVGQDRGYMLIELQDKRQHDQPSIKMVHKKLGVPEFFNVEYTLGPSESLKVAEAEIKQRYGSTLDYGIIRVTLKGDAKILSSTNKLTAFEDSLRKAFKARSVKAIAEPTVTFKEMIPELKTSKTPEDDWTAYIKSGKYDATGLDPDKLIQHGLNLIEVANATKDHKSS